MPLKKESILEALKWNFLDVGTVLFLMGEDGIEPGSWSAEEKSKVVANIIGTVEVDKEPRHIDIANALGAIREAELQSREQTSPAPTASAPRVDIAAALGSMYYEEEHPDYKPDVCEIALMEAFLKHTRFGSSSEAQRVVDTLSRIQRESSTQLEQLTQCIDDLQKRSAALSAKEACA